MIGDWLLGDPEGARVLIHFQGEQWGIRHHFGDDGKQIYSMAFEWIESGDVFISTEPSMDGPVARKIRRTDCEENHCVVIEGFEGEFVRIAPE